jgi:hypothetical protein
MSGITNMSSNSFTDMSTKASERLVHNHPMINSQTKSVSRQWVECAQDYPSVIQWAFFSSQTGRARRVRCLCCLFETRNCVSSEWLDRQEENEMIHLYSSLSMKWLLICLMDENSRERQWRNLKINNERVLVRCMKDRPIDRWSIDEVNRDLLHKSQVASRCITSRSICIWMSPCYCCCRTMSRSNFTV